MLFDLIITTSSFPISGLIGLILILAVLLFRLFEGINVVWWLLSISRLIWLNYWFGVKVSWSLLTWRLVLDVGLLNWIIIELIVIGIYFALSTFSDFNNFDDYTNDNNEHNNSYN